MTVKPYAFKPSQEEEGKTKKKPIEFIKVLGGKDTWPASQRARNWDNIKLICTSYDVDAPDIMYAYNNEREEKGCVYAGFWNDGVKE